MGPVSVLEHEAAIERTERCEFIGPRYPSEEFVICDAKLVATAEDNHIW